MYALVALVLMYKVCGLCYAAPMMLTATLTAPRSLADALLELTDTLPGLSLDVAEDVLNENYKYTYFLDAADKAAFEDLLGTLGIGHMTFAEVDESVDYVARNRELFPPLVIGPFFIARNEEDAPEGLIKLDIMPNRAFGSGEHATTTGCLLAYMHLITNRPAPFVRGLDFGAGSGILAIAAARRDGTTFVCIDNDQPSVEINAQNGKLNGVDTLLTCLVGDVPPAGERFGLVFANILLQPLLELAPGLVASVEDGGNLVLSGFTSDQAGQIEAAYAKLGMRKTWEHVQGDWVAQVWQS